MGFAYNLSKTNDYNELIINYAAIIPESYSNKLYNSIVKINNNNDNIATGFFMKLKIDNNDLFFLITCNHVISQNYIDQNLPLHIFYGKKNEENKQSIILDKKKRLIINYTNPIDIILIQIIEEDNIPKDKFLMVDYNYLNGFETYRNKDFCTAGYPNSFKGERCISFGRILNINNYDGYEFEYSLDEKYCSSGSPICLSENHCIIGINKKIDKNKNINYGTFIGIIFHRLEEEYKQQVKEIKNNYLKQKEENLMTKDINKKDILILDSIIKKDCKPNEDYYYFFAFINTRKDSQFLINASIFDKPNYSLQKQEFLNKFNYNTFNDLEKACIGSILGMAIGDAIGSRVEFKPLNYNFKDIKDMGTFPDGQFNLKPGQWTEKLQWDYV